MTIIRTYSKLNKKIRHCNKDLKHFRRAKKAYLDEATYHQAVIDNVSQIIKKEESP